MIHTIDLSKLNVDSQLREMYRLAGDISGSAVLSGEARDAGDVERVRKAACKILRDIVGVHIDITGRHPSDPHFNDVREELDE